MARKPTRFRRVLLAATLALLAVVLAAWAISYSLPWQLNRNVPFTLVATSGGRWRSTEHGAFQMFFAQGNAGVLSMGWGITRPVPPQSPDISFVLGPATWSCMLLPSAGGAGPKPAFALVLQPGSVEVLGMKASSFGTVTGSFHELTISYWTLAAMLGGLAAWLWYPMYKHSKMPKVGHCTRCGYDRTGLAPAAACPECGETPAPAPPAA